MLIDWLTIEVPFDLLLESDVEIVRGMSDTIRRFCPATGEVRWETSAWESVRSDSHQIAVKAGAESLRVQGSPARCMGDGDTVFGHELHSMDIRECVASMLEFAFGMCGLGRFTVPFEDIKVTRIDVTGNLVLGSLAQVRQALATLRNVEGGRYRVSQTAGDTVYWSHRSRLTSGKAYAKGPHLKYMLARDDYTGRAYTVDEQLAANRLLRLELSVRSQYIRERAERRWYDMDDRYLMDLWREKFEKMVGEVEVSDEVDLQARLLIAAQKIEDDKAAKAGRNARDAKGQAKAAFCTWCMIEAHGWQFARDNVPRSTWYRHLAILHKSGLGDADISAGKVVALRRHALVLHAVQSWEQLRSVA